MNEWTVLYFDTTVKFVFKEIKQDKREESLMYAFEVAVKRECK